MEGRICHAMAAAAGLFTCTGSAGTKQLQWLSVADGDGSGGSCNGGRYSMAGREARKGTTCSNTNTAYACVDVQLLTHDPLHLN